MDEKTKLKNAHFNDLQQFGDTSFYLSINENNHCYEVLDGSMDAYNKVIYFSLDHPHEKIQYLFDIFHTGYFYGYNQGEINGRRELQRQIWNLLND